MMAYDSEVKEWGVIVQFKFIVVGAMVWAQAGLGAIAIRYKYSMKQGVSNTL